MNSKFKKPAGGISRIRLSLTAIAFTVNSVLLFLLGLSVAPILGVSYPVINYSSKSDLTTQDAAVQEELWCRRIIEGADYQYQTNPFADGMMGEGDFGKAVVQITETEKVAGQVVHIPTIGGAGGPGVVGEGDRIGAEEKIQIGNFDVQIDARWFGHGISTIGRDQTVVGRRWDRYVNDALRFKHAKGRNDDIIMKLIQAAGSSGRNILFPAGVSTRNDLVSANVVSTPLIASAKNTLTSLGALPMELGAKDSGGSRTQRYMFMGTQHALQSLDTEPAYLDAITNGGVRGPENPVFKGNYTEWNATGIYRWNMIDHGNWGPVGSPLCPRAYLGVAITNAAENTEVKGGGNAAAAALTTPKYFQFFSNAAYAFHDGTTIAAITDTDKYIMIINPSGSYGVFKYDLNDGNKLTLSATPQVTIGVGTEVDDFVVGALIVECNANGVPFGRSLCFGREMIAAGRGSINGSPTNPKMGRRTFEERNHGQHIAIGAEAVWGCSVVKRADDIYPGFVIVEHAVHVPGAPIIT